MYRSAPIEQLLRSVAAPSSRRRSRPALALGAVALIGLLLQQRPAAAQSCANPPQISDAKCLNFKNTLDDYKSCYGELYDTSIIPAFTYLAQCSHDSATQALRQALEQAASTVTGGVLTSISTIKDVLDSPLGPNPCIGAMNGIHNELAEFIEGERKAPDLDAYRRATYTLDHLTRFTDLILSANQNRVGCDAPLHGIRQALVFLNSLKLQQLDYCQVLRDNAKYPTSAKIQSLAETAKIDPNIHLNQYFNAVITWNSQCGYFDLSGAGQATIRNGQCAQATLEYTQSLAQLDGSIVGWLAQNRAPIVALSAATASVIFAYAGYGSAAGPIGAAIGAAVGVLISAAEYLMLQHDINELQDLIDNKQQQLHDVIQANYITPDQFDTTLQQQCSAWAPIVEMRVQDHLKNLDPVKHIQEIDGYYSLSDLLNNWYNELFVWAIQPGPDGQRFIDQAAQQKLLAQQDSFNARIFKARADQDTAAAQNRLTNIKADAALLNCLNLSPAQRRVVKLNMNPHITGFNNTCRATMGPIAVQPDAPLPFAASTATSDVVCAYSGFRNDVATLEIHNGDGFASNMTIRDSSGAVLAQLTNISSDTDFSQLSFPGFSCSSDTVQPFGTSADSQLTEGSYALHLGDNIPGLSAPDAATLRSAVQTLDSQLRTKVISCARQLGSPLTTPRTADACGIPTIR
jgi:hypothetical protein